jgi:hypothetical protein
MNKDKIKAQQWMVKVIEEGEKDLKRFKLKPKEKTLIKRMLCAKTEKAKERLDKALQKMMDKKRYAIYQRWQFRQAMVTVASYTPLIVLVAVVSFLLSQPPAKR